jgi:hypothetical protein
MKNRLSGPPEPNFMNDDCYQYMNDISSPIEHYPKSSTISNKAVYRLSLYQNRPWTEVFVILSVFLVGVTMRLPEV